ESPVSLRSGSIAARPGVPFPPGAKRFHHAVSGEHACDQHQGITECCHIFLRALWSLTRLPRGGIFFPSRAHPLGKRDGATRASIPSRPAAVTGSANTT